MTECKYNKNEFCTNDQCPMCADYCPVPDTEGVCKFEEREEEYVLTPQGCLKAAITSAGVIITQDTFNVLWDDFSALMKRFGYVEEN